MVSLKVIISIALVTDRVASLSYYFSFERSSEYEKVILALIACSKNSGGGIAFGCSFLDCYNPGVKN